MYPLNVQLPAPGVGFALANDVSEHQALSDAGYLPTYAPAILVLDRSVLLDQAAVKGVTVDGRWSDKRLAEEVAKAA